MGAVHSYRHDAANPLDVIERVADRLDWSLDRANDSEANLLVAGGWGDIHVSLNWRDDLESLHLACTFEAKVPAGRQEEVARLLSLINEQLYHGHFDLWQVEGHIVYRNNLMLAGGAVANDAQCEALIRLGLQACQHYYPCIQYVCWAGKPAREALATALLQTVGEA
jgi:hypothetical protein